MLFAVLVLSVMLNRIRTQRTLHTRNDPRGENLVRRQKMRAIPHPNIVSSEFKANPFPFLARLRTSEPVYRTALPDGTPVWLLTRYEDVFALLRDEGFTKNRRTALTPQQARKLPWTPPLFRPLERNMLDLDPPDHTRLRSLVHRAFTPHLVEQMRSRVQALAHELLDRVASRGEMDLIRDYALPLPMTIITEILGVPTKDRDRFHKWSNAVVSLTSPNPTLRVLPGVWGFLRYLRKFFRVRRREPRNDLVSALIRAEEAGDRLSEDELLAMVFLLLIAGHETTVNLIGNGMLALLQHSDQMERLANEPLLIKSAVEELLRYTSPVFMTSERYALDNATVHDVNIPRGEMTLGVIGSANRDETVFDNPNDLTITREPNRHLSFGQGIHFCIGAPLARMEAQIAINTLLQWKPNLHLKVDADVLRWRQSIFLRGLEALPVRF